MADAQMIDWSSSENQILINPRMPEKQQQQYLKALNSIKSIHSHIWMATSGSSGIIKWVALSKQAILHSAHAVNEHLQSTQRDVWLNPLPLFHVGGLGILARSTVSGACMELFQPAHGKWNPLEFVTCLAHAEATLTSLVPTQVYDIVAQQMQAPPFLRAAIVGGGALAQTVYLQALALGWNLLPSYGLTECASQVATAVLDSWKQGTYPHLKPLKHVSLVLDARGYLKIHSPSLLSAYAFIQNDEMRVIDPKSCEGWLTTEDRAIFEGGEISLIHRDTTFIKIGGESVDLNRLDHILSDLKLQLGIQEDMALCALSDERLGHTIHLATTSISPPSLNALLTAFKVLVFPYENIRQVHFVDQIPRSSLGKLLRQELIAFCQKE